MSNVTPNEDGVNDYYKWESLYDELGPFVGVPRYLLEYGRYLSVEAKWLYVTLLSFKNLKTKKTFPAYPALMERSGLSRKKVAAAIKELETFNWIGKKRNYSRASDYVLTRPVKISDRQPIISPTKEEQKAYKEFVKREREKKKSERRRLYAFDLIGRLNKRKIQTVEVNEDSNQNFEDADEYDEYGDGIPF